MSLKELDLETIKIALDKKLRKDIPEEIIVGYIKSILSRREEKMLEESLAGIDTYILERIINNYRKKK